MACDWYNSGGLCIEQGRPGAGPGSRTTLRFSLSYITHSVVQDVALLVSDRTTKEYAKNKAAEAVALEEQFPPKQSFADWVDSKEEYDYHYGDTEVEACRAIEVLLEREGAELSSMRYYSRHPVCDWCTFTTCLLPPGDCQAQANLHTR